CPARTVAYAHSASTPTPRSQPSCWHAPGDGTTCCSRQGSTCTTCPSPSQSASTPSTNHRQAADTAPCTTTPDERSTSNETRWSSSDCPTAEPSSHSSEFSASTQAASES